MAVAVPFEQPLYRFADFCKFLNLFAPTNIQAFAEALRNERNPWHRGCIRKSFVGHYRVVKRRGFALSGLTRGTP